MMVVTVMLAVVISGSSDGGKGNKSGVRNDDGASNNSDYNYRLY